MDRWQIKMIVMSKVRLAFLLIFFSALIWGSTNTVVAQQFDQNSAKVVNVKNNPNGTKTVTYQDASGNTQLAMIDCSGVDAVWGLNSLCHAIDSMGDALTTSIQGIATTIGNMPNAFTDLIKLKSKDLVWSILKGTIESMNLILTGQAPPTTTSSLDQEPRHASVPAPLSLVMSVYKNPPNLDTNGSLAYIIDNNILGIKNSLAADCSNWPGGANSICPGRIRLNPVFNIWEKIRNISYIALTVVLIIYGFMVMFRTKIDPRTIITVQSAIPRLAIGLIAIAFSYTIASLAVDIGQVLTSTVGLFFQPFWSGGPGVALNCVLAHDPCIPMPFFDSPLALQSGLGSVFSINITVPNDPLGIMGGLINLITQFIVWYIFFQVFFALITNYAQIFIKTALAPILLAVGIIPSQSDALSKWFKGILGNALVFPGIYFVLNFAVYINNFIPKVTLPGPLDQVNDIKGFVALGLVVIASKVPAMIEELLQTQASGAVSRAGADVGQVARKIPIIGGLLG